MAKEHEHDEVEPKRHHRLVTPRRDLKKAHASPRSKSPKNPPEGYAEDQPGSAAHEEPKMK